MATVLKPSAPTVIVDGELDDDEILLHIPADAHTLAGYRRWVLSDAVPEKLKVMFLKGEIYLDMSKEAINHAVVKSDVARPMLNFFDELDLGNLYINGVLVVNVEADVSNNPDMVGVLWESLEAGKVRYVVTKKEEMEIEGSPDWLLEIVSAGSVTKDYRQLREAYHQAGVREYWIIDARKDELRFQILHWRKSGDVAAPSKVGWLRSRVFPRSFQLTRNRDRRGAWRYTLAMKED